MPEEISIDTLSQIVVVRSSGHITVNDLASSREQIFEIYRETGINKVLVDAREQKSFITITDSYRRADDLGENPISRKLKFAILPSIRTEKELRFIETTSRNKGLSVMIHDSKESAIKWLKGELPSNKAL
jgi:hypothetical protein